MDRQSRRDPGVSRQEGEQLFLHQQPLKLLIHVKGSGRTPLWTDAGRCGEGFHFCCSDCDAVAESMRASWGLLCLRAFSARTGVLGPALPLRSELVHHDCSRQSVFSPGGRRGRRNRARRWVVGSMSGLLRRRCLRTLLGARLGRRDCPQTRERSPLGAVTMVPPGGWSLVDNKRNTHIFMQTFHTLGIHFIPK
jgi:hypothetical protein